MMTLGALTFLLTQLHAQPLSGERFEGLHALILPQGREFAWYEEIPWLTSIEEALEKAAAEGKPILVWTSADGQPCGAT